MSKTNKKTKDDLPSEKPPVVIEGGIAIPQAETEDNKKWEMKAGEPFNEVQEDKSICKVQQFHNPVTGTWRKEILEVIQEASKS